MFIRATDWTRWPNRPVSALVGNVADLKNSALGTAGSTQGAVLAADGIDNQLVAVSMSGSWNSSVMWTDNGSTWP